MEEDELATIVDSDYPILAVTIWKESRRQINEVPEEIWIELRERLMNRSAQEVVRRSNSKLLRRLLGSSCGPHRSR